MVATTLGRIQYAATLKPTTDKLKAPNMIGSSGPIARGPASPTCVRSSTVRMSGSETKLDFPFSVPTFSSLVPPIPGPFALGSPFPSSCTRAPHSKPVFLAFLMRSRVRAKSCDFPS